jgi:hypothetical protein
MVAGDGDMVMYILMVLAVVVERGRRSDVVKTENTAERE